MIGFLAQASQPVVITGAEVFEQVSGFYNNAWNQLQFMLAALIAILVAGIGLVPWWISRQQEKSFAI